MSRFADLASSARYELWAILALRHARGIGVVRANRLLHSYGSAFAAAEAALSDPSAWHKRGIVPLPTARAFASGAWREGARREWAAARRSGCGLLCRGDSRYPDSLAEIDDAPLLLYYQGDVSLLRGPAVAVIGARDCTREGMRVSAFFSRALTRAGVTIVSGMAKGIDRAAHIAGLEGPGRSIAVLGTGIDVAYPVHNADIHARLGRDGLLLSEFAPGTQPLAAHFPVRNRLISGLSRGVLVVEATGRSGSLITARLALEQNREVFAAPGSALSNASAGCHELIRRGAKPVFQADDILMELAPLLTLEARKALEKRRSEKPTAPAPARNPAADPHEADLADAQAVLPEGSLPWKPPAGGAHNRQSGVRRKNSGRADAPSHEISAPGAPGNAEQRLLSMLGEKPLHIDELARELDLDVARLSGVLTLLEMRGQVRRVPGMYYTRPELCP